MRTAHARRRRRAQAFDRLEDVLRRAAGATDDQSVRAWLLAMVEHGEAAEGGTRPAEDQDGARK